MIKYTSQNQLSFEKFELPFSGKLDGENRWVKLSEVIPWDELAGVYHRSLKEGIGAPGKEARLVIGALVIKHELKLDDRGTVEMIRENPYLQYFCGFTAFTTQSPFDASLFVHIRKRLGEDSFEKMNTLLLQRAYSEHGTRKQKTKPEEPNSTEEVTHQGKMQADATVADADIAFPTDLDLLNSAREKSEQLIDELYAQTRGNEKPRTYRRMARKEYLLTARKKRKTMKEIHRANGKQIRYLKRNITSIHRLMDGLGVQITLKKTSYRYFLIIQELLRQQIEMHNSGESKVSDRIVSIHQPHVRPIVRGKSGRKVEFGAKISVSYSVGGFATIDRLNWDAYNEGGDLIGQIEKYRQLHGVYPEVVLADQIYMTRQNRDWLKAHGIRHTGKPLGRRSKEEPSALSKQKLKKEHAERNRIEGKFGQAKQGYNLDWIRARRSDTSVSWINCIFFLMNIKWLLKLFLSSFFSPFIKALLYSLDDVGFVNYKNENEQAIFVYRSAFCSI